MQGRPDETVVTSTCGHNCGGRCVVNAHVQDGRIVHISTDARRWNPDHPPLPACARGVGQIERTYHPDRLRYPMRRSGKRGAGEFTRISWDEALDTVAQELLRVRAAYGNAAMLDLSRSGSLSMLHSRSTAKRFFNMFGGSIDLWSNMSAEAEIFAVRTTYGAVYKAAGREPTDYANSKLILMWGWSPGDGTFGTGTMQYLKHAKQQGTRIICVDPRRTLTSRQLADEHIFINPGTDTAALIAMAYVIVGENLHDQDFCDRYVLGFDDAHLPPDAPRRASYRTYLMGEADGVAKTPGMGRSHHRHAGRNDPPAGDRIRHQQTGGVANRLCARPHDARRAIPSRRLCAGGDHRQCRDQGRQFRCQQRRHRPHRHREPAHRHESDRCASCHAPAAGSARARQKRRLSRPTSNSSIPPAAICSISAPM